VHRKKHDVLNGALSGAMIRNVHFDELPYLMEVMAEQGVDVASAWKVRPSAVPRTWSPWTMIDRWKG